MTNGRNAAIVGMASFMTKKKKYKFQVDICLEELLEVPFISAVLFAKLRLLDGGSFQDHSSREEVKDHKVSWGAKFSFPCKMLANASTGVLERCVLRISIRKESKGGRSFNKLGFVDLNLAEYAGAGITYKKALLVGYDARHRQDNSMLKFSIAMNMLSGDVLFKVPSPSLRPKSAAAEEPPQEQRTEDYSGGSHGGSIASGSSGFGSLPKKRPALLSSELVIGQTLSENNIPVTVASDCSEPIQIPVDHEEIPLGEPGHSRNSSNTSQLSKASGYSSIHSHSHSRQSSSGDSGHIRNLHSSLRIASFYKSALNSSKFTRTQSIPTRISSSYPHPPGAVPNGPEPSQDAGKTSKVPSIELNPDESIYSTPKGSLNKQTSNMSSSSNEEYKTPEGGLDNRDVFSQNFNELQKSFSTTAVEFQRMKHKEFVSTKNALNSKAPEGGGDAHAVMRSKSDYALSPITSKSTWWANRIPESLYAFLTPSPKRKNMIYSTPTRPVTVSNPFKISPVPLTKQPFHTISLNSLQNGAASSGEAGGQRLGVQSVKRNPSSSSLALSETGSLDRAKAAFERRKKNQLLDSDAVPVAGRVENTRVNPDHLIEDLLKNTNLEPADDEAETSGLQLFIAKDGTAALGNHEVKSQMSTGVQLFKQVVMDDNR
ncbi:uncharacterized protein LOC123318709 isoform X2 [Coccinella septempunctata]|uniref:uncharacterized protein LOC123318709 isoform X2 n=1 Tax=Coccinella septempunctata TaxID=41139 RepID=UPI001D08C264|nr:uncharacterized protein LOC123318709 isoform X2 [Coccinella septempunctata]